MVIQELIQYSKDTHVQMVSAHEAVSEHCMLTLCGSKQVAKNTSLIYSIIESCRMNGLRPIKYIVDISRKLVSSDTEYIAFLPMNIAK